MSLVTTVAALASKNRFIMVWIGNSPAVALGENMIKDYTSGNCPSAYKMPERYSG